MTTPYILDGFNPSPYSVKMRTRAFYAGLGFELVLTREPPGSSPNPLACYLKPL